MDAAVRGVPRSGTTLRRDSGAERDSAIVPAARCPKRASIATSRRPSRPGPSTVA